MSEISIKNITPQGFDLKPESLPIVTSDYNVKVKATMADGQVLETTKKVTLEVLPIESVVISGDATIQDYGNHEYTLNFLRSDERTPNVGVKSFSVSSNVSADVLAVTKTANGFVLSVTNGIDATQNVTMSVVVVLEDDSIVNGEYAVKLNCVKATSVSISGESDIQSKRASFTKHYDFVYSAGSTILPSTAPNVTSTSEKVTIKNVTINGFDAVFALEEEDNFTFTLSATFETFSATKNVKVELLNVLIPLIITNRTGSSKFFSYKMGKGESSFEVATMSGHVKGAEDYEDVVFTTKSVTTAQISVTLQPNESFLIQSRTHVPSNSNYLQFVIEYFAPEFDGDVLGTCGGKMKDYACRSMFQNCYSLTTAPELPATTLAQECYSNMFSGCSNLTTAPELPATTLAQECYWAMFNGCTSLTTAPSKLPATTLAPSCYQYMFQNCSKLTTALELPATTLTTSCYGYMFSGCSALTTAPELPATTLAQECYQYMFQNCSKLTTAPELPATTLADYCYRYMFSGCSALTTAPELPATTLKNYCYQYMFQNCSNLNYVKAMFTTTPSSSYTGSWLYGVSSTGTFVKNPEATWNVSGTYGIPEKWNIDNGYFEYVNFIAYGGNKTLSCVFTGVLKGKSVSSITFSNSAFSASNITTDGFTLNVNGITGDTTTNVTIVADGETYNTSISAKYLEKVTPLIIMNTTGSAQTFGYKMGNGSSSFEVATMSGHVKGVEDYEDVEFTKKSLSTSQQNVTLQPNESFLIQSRTHVPSTTNNLRFVITSFAPEFDGDVLGTCGGKMKDYACYYMFNDCTGLTTAPELPATTLASYCYYNMFYGCTGLTEAPELPATTLANYCYWGMFYDCTGLTTAPSVLPATTLARGCYYQMFYNCTGLTTAPELPATILAQDCYFYMFRGCSNLNYVKAMFTTTPGSYTSYWLYGVASTGTFVKNSAATWSVSGESGIPSGWSVVTATS